MWLRCKTQDEITEEINLLYESIKLGRTGVQRVIDDRKAQMRKNDIAPESLQTDTIWMFQNNDPRYGMEYPGRISISTAELVFNHENKPVTTSLIVAQAFEKRHDNVLQAIQTLGCPKSFTALNFQASDYTDSTGRKLPMYIVTRKGFALLGMGFTGEKAMQFNGDVTFIVSDDRFQKRF